MEWDSILAWNNGTVLKLATNIHENRDYYNLPILADALEEAGCFDETILNHLRSGECPKRNRTCGIVWKIFYHGPRS